jgi:hypothetical protein
MLLVLLLDWAIVVAVEGGEEWSGMRSVLSSLSVDCWY